MRRISAGASLIALALSAPAIAAQEQSDADAGRGTLAEIVVTAQRREESAQNVPIAIKAVSAEQLQNSGVKNLQDLSVIVPGFAIQQGAANANAYLRGVGSQVLGPGLESPVATYVDGVYYASAFGAPGGLTNVERVEVLKGPQGTLFGRNATGGLVQVITRTPSHDAAIEVHGGYANYETTAFDAYATAGLGDALAVDISASLVNQGKGYGVNLVSGKDVNRTDKNLQLRSKWLLTPAEGTKITAIFDYNSITTSRNVFRVLPGTGLPVILGPNYGGSVFDTAMNLDPYIRSTGGGASLKIEQNLGFAKLVSISAYREGDTTATLDLDATATFFSNVDPLVQHETQYTQELQLQSNGDSALQWIIGGFYYKDTASVDQTNRFGPTVRPPFTGLRNQGTQTTESIAGFAQATLALGPDTNFTGGIRYSDEKRSLLANGFALTPVGQVQTVNNFTATKTFGRATWRAALDHRFSPEVMVYAAVNTGFKSGGFNAVAPTQPAFNPEKMTAYSAGFKMDLLDRRLRVNGEFFYYDYSDLQLGVVLVLAPGVTSPGVINGGKSRVYGFDFDVAAKLDDNITLSGGFEILNSKFVKSASNFAIGSPSGTVPTFLGSVTGNKIPYSPNFVGTLAADYAFDLAGGKTNFNVTYQYNDGYFTEPDNVISQGSFSLLSASLRWSAPGDHYSVAFWGKNLTNSRVLQNELTLGFGPHYGNYLAPRTYGVTLGAKF